MKNMTEEVVGIVLDMLAHCINTGWYDENNSFTKPVIEKLIMSKTENVIISLKV